MKLYNNKISSAASRVRIALALKGIAVEREEITILGTDAHNLTADYRAVNPQGLVPALVTEKGTLLTQSLAIIEYLDDLQAEPALLPKDPEAKAQARAVALAIAAEIHALVPPRVAARLSELPGVDDATIAAWRLHWVRIGLAAVEDLLQRHPGSFCVGDAPSVADIFLFPQAVQAEWAGLSLDQWPRIAGVVAKLKAIPAFAENGPAPRE